MPERAKARLVVSRDEAKRQILERLERAGEINADDVQTAVDLEEAEEKERRWREYNAALLSRLFTTDEYANEYDSARRTVHAVGDRYIDPSLGQLADRLAASIKSQISKLRSIIERLPLIDEGETPTPITEGIAQVERNLDLLIERFHLVTRQIRSRYDSRSTLEINDEYDVQDLLHSLLTIFFDDIRKEEWTPSYAGGASKMDYFLPEIQTAVEVKKARTSLTARVLGEELIVDIAKYQKHPQCRKLVCFVYDPEGSITNPRGIERDLSSQHYNLAVRVMIVPRLR